MLKIICALAFSLVTSVVYAEIQNSNHPLPIPEGKTLFGNQGTVMINPNDPSIETIVEELQQQKKLYTVQLQNITQRLDSLRQFINAQNALQLQWKNAQNGQTVSDAFKLDLNGQTSQICKALFRGGFHPGVLKSTGCLITYGGYSVIVQTYKVLAGKAKTEWRAVEKLELYQHPESSEGRALWQDKFVPIQAGFENGIPLYICKASYNNQVYVGKTINDVCNFALINREITVKDFQVLFGEKTAQ